MAQPSKILPDFNTIEHNFKIRANIRKAISDCAKGTYPNERHARLSIF